MKLKMYEIDAIVSEIVNKITKHNNSLTIPNERELELELEKTHPVIIEVNQLIEQIRGLNKNIKKIWKTSNFSSSFYESVPNVYGLIKHITNKELDEIKKQIGFKVIDQQRIRNLVILNSNKDLEEIINIVSSELGIKI